MASLKEIKSRILSIKTTRQITSAMKMISSAKLHKAQKDISDLYPYHLKLNQILCNLIEYETRDEQKWVIPFSTIKEVKKVLLVAVSSNSSLCGAFNTNVAKRLASITAEYQEKGVKVAVMPVGKIIKEHLPQNVEVLKDDFNGFVDKPSYDVIMKYADSMAYSFDNGDYDKIEFIYHHFKSSASQVLIRETYLPFIQKEIPLLSVGEDVGSMKEHKPDYEVNYLIEPDRQTLIKAIVDKVIRFKLYTVFMDSIASEHAARTIAMQVATDNADQLLQELNIQYNKSRQQSITNELLDIIGGSVE
ncbi:MAG: ATP synthase F1 subunit gamma [Bacteroidales bacterium]|nr:ATP synthase F1 subunit gamma [Bacteroidales bacterium]